MNEVAELVAWQQTKIAALEEQLRAAEKAALTPQLTKTQLPARDELAVTFLHGILGRGGISDMDTNVANAFRYADKFIAARAAKEST